MKPIYLASRLAIPALLGVIVFPFMFWRDVIILTIIQLHIEESIPVVIWAFPIAVLLVGFLYNLALNLLWNLILKLLWSQPSKALMPGSWKDWLIGYSVMTVATLAIALLYIATLPHRPGLSFYLSNQHQQFAQSREIPNFLLRWLWLWLLFVFSLYTLKLKPSRTHKRTKNGTTAS